MFVAVISNKMAVVFDITSLVNTLPKLPDGIKIPIWERDEILDYLQDKNIRRYDVIIHTYNRTVLQDKTDWRTREITPTTEVRYWNNFSCQRSLPFAALRRKGLEYWSKTGYMPSFSLDLNEIEFLRRQTVIPYRLLDISSGSHSMRWSGEEECYIVS